LACSCFPKINVGFSPINVASTSLLSLLQWFFNPTQHSEVNSMETYSDLAYILLTSPVFILGITFLSYIFFNRINLIHIFFGPS
jgi:two-component system sensor histidine kinase AgrC